MNVLERENVSCDFESISPFVFDEYKISKISLHDSLDDVRLVQIVLAILTYAWRHGSSDVIVFDKNNTAFQRASTNDFKDFLCTVQTYDKDWQMVFLKLEPVFEPHVVAPFLQRVTHSYGCHGYVVNKTFIPDLIAILEEHSDYLSLDDILSDFVASNGHCYAPLNPLFESSHEETIDSKSHR